MSEITIFNPFKSKNVFIIGELTNGVKIELNTYKKITIDKDSGKYTFKYIVDDIETLCPNQLKEICEDGIERHYIVIMDGYYDKSYLESAIMMGDIYANYYLGEYYGMDHNYDEMVKYYKIAAANGIVHAMYLLGMYYHFTVRDYPKMLHYYIMAANNGCILSMNSLAYYYSTIDYNLDETIKYSDMAAETRKHIST